MSTFIGRFHDRVRARRLASDEIRANYLAGTIYATRALLYTNEAEELGVIWTRSHAWHAKRLARDEVELSLINERLFAAGRMPRQVFDYRVR